MWIIIVPADPVYKVWPRDVFAPCEITIPDDDLVLNLTSLTYPVQVLEAIGFRAAAVTEAGLIPITFEGMDFSPAEVTSISLREILKSYNDWPAEGMDFLAAEVTSIELRQILKSHVLSPEGMDFSPAEVTSISLENKLITYENWPAEGMDFAPAEITSISLITP